MKLYTVMNFTLHQGKSLFPFPYEVVIMLFFSIIYFGLNVLQFQLCTVPGYHNLNQIDLRRTFTSTRLKLKNYFIIIPTYI